MYLARLEERRLQNEITRDQHFTGLVINFDQKSCRIVSYFNHDNCFLMIGS
ncbi:unnamed protein product [Moneuplotes crassus]|uniref:Uncharacterized protein n=1 Tax=Euplotes crassus TaxID=5936 RepID=A0AAD1X3S3_EUPCR|nr:unnamed protein product [Moneuplotes crassus]